MNQRDNDPVQKTQTHQVEDLELFRTDPIKHAAFLIAGDEHSDLEQRLKTDIYHSLCRIKPEIAEHDFDAEIMTGTLLPTLSAPLQGIAIARAEGALAFYNRVGWHPKFLGEPLQSCIENVEGLNALESRYHAKDMHDLAYVHPRHFEKIFGKPGAAALWESIKRFTNRVNKA